MKLASETTWKNSNLQHYQNKLAGIRKYSIHIIYKHLTKLKGVDVSNRSAESLHEDSNE